MKTRGIVCLVWAVAGLSIGGPGMSSAAEMAFNFRLAVQARDITERLVPDGLSKDRNRKNGPVVVVGCRNGAFSGQAVVSSPEPIRNLKVVPSDLTNAENGGVIPAAAVQARYAIQDRPGPRQRGPGGVFDGLDVVAPDEPPLDTAGGALVQPVCLTVRVPADAKPGNYEGRVVFSTEELGKTAIVLKLKVIDWVLPASKAFGSHVGIIQSPESVALYYQVPMWSEEHWRMIERSLAILGQIGNDEVYITCINKTHFGNEHGMVRFVKQADGSYRPDFSLAEKYLDLVRKHFGTPPVVCLYVWEFYSGYGWHLPESETIKTATQKEPLLFTVLDPKTGALSQGEAPSWGTPECRAFWKPVMDGMREILRKRGLEKSLTLGLACDARPSSMMEADFLALAPDVKWALHSHPYQEKLWKQPLALGAFVWGARQLKAEYATDLQFGWKPQKSGMIYTIFPRGGLTLGTPLDQLRLRVEGYLASGMNGVSRQGADFWPVDLGSKHPYMLLSRYGALPGAVCLGTCGNPSWLSAGKEGPVSSQSFEMLREGVQETEARIFMEKTLDDAALRAKLGPDLEKRSRGILAERVMAMIGKSVAGQKDKGLNLSAEAYAAALAAGQRPWQTLSEELYTAAADVAVRLGSPQAAKLGNGH